MIQFSDSEALHLAALLNDPIFKKAFLATVNSQIPSGDGSGHTIEALALRNAYSGGWHDFGRKLASFAVPPSKSDTEQLPEPWEHIGLDDQ